MDLTKLRKGVRIGAAALTLVVAGGGSAALASYDATNSTTGFNSVNRANVRVSDTMVQRFLNNARANNNVAVNANSGSNRANNNTGDGEVMGGDVRGNIEVNSVLNSGTGGLMPIVLAGSPDVNVGNDHTGSQSSNAANVTATTTNRVEVRNTGVANNSLSGSVRTGNNTANNNTGDGTAASGDIQVGASFGTDINANAGAALTVVGDGAAHNGNINVGNDTTGANSTNTASATVTNSTVVTVQNTGVVNNSIALDLQSGNNHASNNTGDGTASSGDIDFDLDITNAVN
jgi:hypothetical protein